MSKATIHQDEVDVLRLENERLTNKLNEWAETYNKIIEDGSCASDEYHCTCVPALREEIAKLRIALEKYEDETNWHVNSRGVCYWTYTGYGGDIAREALDVKK